MQFKVVFIKIPKVSLLKPEFAQMAEQTYYSETEKFQISIPDGYVIFAVTQYLPDVEIKSDLKKLE